MQKANKLKVLAITSDAEISSFINSAFNNNVFELESKNSPYDAMFILEKFNPNIIITEECSNVFNALEFIKYIKKLPLSHKIFIFHFSNCLTKEKALTLVNAGVSDIIIKNSISNMYSNKEFLIRIINRIKTKGNKLPDKAKNQKELEKKESALCFCSSGIKNNNSASNVIHKEQFVSQQIEIKNLVSENYLYKKLNNINQAKAVPFLASELLNLTNDSQSNINQMSKIVEMDPAITAKVLKFANSAYYNSINKRILNLNEAIVTIGFDGVKDVVFGISVIDQFISQNDSSSDLDRYRLFFHSLSTGIICQKISKLIDKENSDRSFVIGMLHDIGMAIFDDYFPKEYPQVIDTFLSQTIDIDVVERTMMSADHSEVGSKIFKSWGFPQNIYEPILYHHKEFKDIYEKMIKSLKQSIILRLSDSLSKLVGASIFKDERIEPIPYTVFKYLKLCPNELTKTILDVNDLSKEMMQIFLLHIDPKCYEKVGIPRHLTNLNKKILLINTPDKYYDGLPLLLKELNCRVIARNDDFINLADIKPDCTFIYINKEEDFDIVNEVETKSKLNCLVISNHLKDIVEKEGYQKKHLILYAPFSLSEFLIIAKKL